MASDVVIRAEGLGKKYIIGHQSAEHYSTLRDIISRSAKNWARSLGDMARGAANVAGDELEEFWALKDVNFEIRRGDVVGIIGRNGAGKSTLLKVLSRITEPSEGRVEIKGRVASLLEVGTGFHPELTGRENVYLNGAILGMTREEIKRKFDEIVAFAEIDKFLDTPVKRYSSGMYVRLAFAVAAHLEPEILVVDEVLAVGDVAFQKKCLGKMQDVAGHGRTVLFVSHNISAVRALCRHGLYLSAGRVVSTGSAAEVLDLYMSQQAGTAEGPARNPLVYSNHKPPKNGRPWISAVEVATSSGNDVQEYGTPLNISVTGSHPNPINSPSVSVQIHNSSGVPVLHTGMDTNESFGSASSHTTWSCEIPFLRLNVGHYYVTIYFSGPPGSEHYETVEQACFFEVVRTTAFSPWGWRPGVCAYFEDASWSIRRDRQFVRVDASDRVDEPKAAATDGARFDFSANSRTPKKR